MNSSILKPYQIFIIFVLLIITFFTFFTSIDSGFANLDDHFLVRRKLYNCDFSTLTGLKTFFLKPTSGIYQPIVDLSFSIELKLFTSSFGVFRNQEAAFFHFDNIILHIINTFLVFILFFKLTKHFFTAYIMMALFAIHPVHVEVVSWVSARKDLLYSLFYLLSIFFYIKSYETKKNLFLTISFFCFVLSTMSKPMAVTLPVILVLIDYFNNKLNFNKKTIIKYLPYIIISIFFIILGIFVHYTDGIAKPFVLYTLFKNILSAHFHYLFYLYKFVLPINLYCSYPYFYPLKEFPPIYITLSPIVIYIGIYFLFKTLKYSKKIFFGFFWFIIVLLPSSGILPTGIVKVADRYCYLAYIGLFYLVAILIVYLYKKTRIYLKHLLIFICLFIFSVLIYLSYERTLDWKNNNTEPPIEKQIYKQESVFFV